MTIRTLAAGLALTTIGAGSAIAQYAFTLDWRGDLYRANFTTGHAAFVGHVPYYITDIAYDATTKQLFGAGGGDFFSLDITTGASSYLGSSFLENGLGGMDFLNGTLYATYSTRIFRVDTSNGQPLDEIDADANNGGGSITFDPTGTRAYMLGYEPNVFSRKNLYREDLSGHVTILSTGWDNSTQAIHWLDGTMYVLSQDGGYYDYDPETGHSQGHTGKLENGIPGFHEWRAFTSANAVPEPSSVIAFSTLLFLARTRRSKGATPSMAAPKDVL